jgi:putative adenylate-forming enzyme
MRPAYQRRRLQDFAAGLRLGRRLIADQRLSRAELLELQRRRLDAIVRHAAAHSAFYRERLAGRIGAGPVELDALPVLTKAEMMAGYDELVTDPRLRRDDLLDWIAAAERDDHYLGEFRVMTTSGSSGRKGLFVYDRDAWRWVIGMFLRQSDAMGVTPRVPRRRIAAVHGAAQAHMSRQVTTSVAVGAHRLLTLPVTLPVGELVERLNRFRPDFVTGYPSVLARLAEEQLEGRLRLRLSGASTSSELRTREVTARIREAFGVEPFDIYATTEGLWGGECDRHGGVHLFEDVTLVENVDEEGRPVPPGEAGARLLLTSLVNRVQPIIRLEVTDAMVLDDAPCACGRSLLRARVIEGRTDDVVELPGAGGTAVAVLPLEFGLVGGDPDVAEFQVVQRGTALDLRVVPRAAAGEALEARLQEALSGRLADLGVAAPDVRVERVAQLPRTAGGKLQLVVAERHAAAAVA